MEQTLKQRIAAQQAKVNEAQRVLTAEQATLRALQMQQLHCKHVWGKPIQNWEHEGCYCELCGANDIWAHSQRATNR